VFWKYTADFNESHCVINVSAYQDGVCTSVNEQVQVDTEILAMEY